MKFIELISYDSYGNLRLLIKGKEYIWYDIPMPVSEWIDYELKHNHNQGRLLKHLEMKYGKGVLATDEDTLHFKIQWAIFVKKLAGEMRRG